VSAAKQRMVVLCGARVILRALPSAQDDTGGSGVAGVRTLVCAAVLRGLIVWLTQTLIKTCGFEGFDPIWRIKGSRQDSEPWSAC